MLDANDVIEVLRLAPHPEGGWFKETWRDVTEPGQRAPGTAIYYLLRAGEHSSWHRIDSTEIWHFYAGAPLALAISDGQATREIRLGGALENGELPQCIMPPSAWQSAESTGKWSLVGCTVSPGFEFAGFERGEPNVTPGGSGT